jgi:peptide-methionine (S)-S-oxide reductase
MLDNFMKKGINYMKIIAITASICGLSTLNPALASLVPDPSEDMQLASQPGSHNIVLAGGCFWGVQAVFQHTKGVKEAISGYAGGKASTAHYEMIGSGTTGHAESVKITYDPSVITLGTILKIYFSIAHNPTELNFQGPDRGTQYRSAIFYANPEQKKLAENYIAQLNSAAIFSGPIVTTLEPLQEFYPAEAYHQDYAKLNPDNPYIVRHDLPKVANLQKLFPHLYINY